MVCFASSYATVSRGLYFQMAYISGSNMLYMKNCIQVVHVILLKRVSFLILKNPHEFVTPYSILHESLRF